MVVCAASKCSNSSRIKNMRFFKFPSEEQRRKLWIEKSSLPKEPGSYAKLCEVHFEESQFELHRQDGWRKLKPNAIPTVFPDPVETPKKRKEKTTLKRKRSRSCSSEEEESDIDVDNPPNVPPLKIVRCKKSNPRLVTPESPNKKKSLSKKGSSQSSKSFQKENALPKKKKGRPRKVATPELESSSETEVDEPEEPEKLKEKCEQEKQLAVLKRENESMRQEIHEFEKHNKAMSHVIQELEKHNKAMSAKLQELDKDNKVMSRKLGELEKQNEDLRAKLNCCFSEEQFQRMEKLMALGKIERYIPGIK